MNSHHYTKAEIDAILARHDESGERNPLAFSVRMADIIRQLQEENAHLKKLLDIAHHNLQEEQRRVIKKDSHIALLEGEIKRLTRPLGTGKSFESSADA